MPTRPDLRDLATNVKDAFTDMDRETLLEILTFVIKEYVVEGPPPMLVHQAETLSDLKPANFAQLVTALQARFDFAELSMLVVDGDQVSARVGGVVQPLLGGPRQMPANIQMVDTRPQPGVSVVEMNTMQRPPSAPATAPAAAPPPTRGLSIRGRPSEGEAPAARPAPSTATPAGGTPAAPAAPPAAAAPQEKPEGAGGDDASARFSLLELD